MANIFQSKLCCIMVACFTTIVVTIVALKPPVALAAKLWVNQNM